ncbi:IS1 transposase, partial [Thiothrix eikelboomii]
LLERFTFRLYCTDDWGAYERLLPEDQHLITKRYTQSIERQNLNLRTHLKRLARKTICFSRSVEVHDKVVGEYIARHSFNWLNT